MGRLTHLEFDGGWVSVYAVSEFDYPIDTPIGVGYFEQAIEEAYRYACSVEVSCEAQLQDSPYNVLLHAKVDWAKRLQAELLAYQTNARS